MTTTTPIERFVEEAFDAGRLAVEPEPGSVMAMAMAMAAVAPRPPEPRRPIEALLSSQATMVVQRPQQACCHRLPFSALLLSIDLYRSMIVAAAAVTVDPSSYSSP